MQKEEFKEVIREAMKSVSPLFQVENIIFTTHDDAVMGLAGRHGGKSGIIRVVGYSGGAEKEEFTVKRYLEDARSIMGPSPIERHYFTERSVLDAIPIRPKTYLKGLHYDNSHRFIVFPGISRVTLEQMMNNPDRNFCMDKSEKSLALLNHWRDLVYVKSGRDDSAIPSLPTTDLQANIEQNLSSLSGGKFTGLRRLTEENYLNDMKRYGDILGRFGFSLSPEKIDRVLEGLTNKEILGPNPHDCYPWHNTLTYLIDPADVPLCPVTIMPACTFGHHTVANRVGMDHVDYLLERYVAGSPRWMQRHILDTFFPCSVYGNMRELAGAATIRKTKIQDSISLEGYIREGLACTEQQAGRL